MDEASRGRPSAPMTAVIPRRTGPCSCSPRGFRWTASRFGRPSALRASRVYRRAQSTTGSILRQRRSRRRVGARMVAIGVAGLVLRAASVTRATGS